MVYLQLRSYQGGVSTVGRGSHKKSQRRGGNQSISLRSDDKKRDFNQRELNFRLKSKE